MFIASPPILTMMHLCIMLLYTQGRPSPPETMMHFPPVSDFPPIFKKLSDSEENFKNLSFPENFFDFHPPIFLMTFF